MPDDDPLTAKELAFRKALGTEAYRKWARAVRKKWSATAAGILATRKAKGKSK